jgi:tetratricopeptide (TPR) repeat protein
LQDLAKQLDPAPHLDEVLLLLAKQLGTTTDAAYPHLRRLWAAYPGTAPGRWAASILATHGPFPTWQEVGVRGARLMGIGQFKEASTLLAKHSAQVGEPSPEACKYWFAHGRSLFRQNRVTEAERVLSPAGTRCVGLDPDRAAKSFYLAGKSLERKGAWASAAIHYARIADHTPDHSYADDGLLLAGIAFQEAGDPAKARDSWSRQVNRYPTGDMAGEAFWRLAWSHWLAGDTDKALAWTDRAVEELPLETDPIHHRAARYWSARWRLFPDRDHPTHANPDQRQEAIDRFRAICLDHPYSWYGILAAARLAVEAPDVAKALPAAPHPPLPPRPGGTGLPFRRIPPSRMHWPCTAWDCPGKHCSRGIQKRSCNRLKQPGWPT